MHMYNTVMHKTPNTIKVLAELARAEQHGHALAHATHIAPPTVYRMLAALEREGWATSRTDGPRKIYALTDAGRSWADAWTRPAGEVVTRVHRKGGAVDVIRWLGANWDAVHEFCGDVARRDGDTLWIRTVDDNEESCALGWWIVQGVRNKYPVPPDVFHATYELP